MRSGDNLVCANELYGGSFSQMKYTFKQLGIEARFVDMTKPETFEQHIDEKTKCIYMETISNPSYNVPDFDVVSGIAKKHQIPLVVDNTFGMCGYTCRPLRLGANIVVQSATKWLGGHGTVIGGMIVDGQNFDWGVKDKDGNYKFPEVADKQPSYHDLQFLEHPVFGVSATNTLFILLARVKTLRDLGGCQSPMNAFQLIQGLETLELRGKAHS
jgi:O-acetylhomoserine/O-acetylserine sulfhydrylase